MQQKVGYSQKLCWIKMKILFLIKKRLDFCTIISHPFSKIIPYYLTWFEVKFHSLLWWALRLDSEEMHVWFESSNCLLELAWKLFSLNKLLLVDRFSLQEYAFFSMELSTFSSFWASRKSGKSFSESLYCTNETT